jgi:glycerate 2-kinase
MIIQNTEQLAKTPLRKDGLAVIEAGFSAVAPQKAIAGQVRLDQGVLTINKTAYNLDQYHNVYVVGFGKSSALMAKSIEGILGDRISSGGVISTKETSLTHVEFYPGTHPFPSQQNIDATKKLVDIVKKTGKDDLILCLISGGGSALLFYPNIPLDKYTEKIKKIFSSGVDIFELNRIRKSLSKVKGGKLAKMTKTKIISLIFSDVIRDDLGTIASGPTYSEDGLDNVDNHLLLTNRVALKAMKDKAVSLGYNPAILTSTLKGEARVAVKQILGKCNTDNDCFLFAGETTVTVKNDGLGGRNQEFCLAAIENISGNDEIVLISAGTDGIDGPGHNAAGAVICNKSLKTAQEQGLDYKPYLKNNDSYHFFKKMNDLIITEITGSNVADIGVVLKKV